MKPPLCFMTDLCKIFQMFDHFWLLMTGIFEKVCTVNVSASTQCLFIHQLSVQFSLQCSSTRASSNLSLVKNMLPMFTSSAIFMSLSPQVTSHPETVSQTMSLQQPPQSQYNMPDRDKQLLFSEFENLSASFRSLYKSVFEQSFSQQGECPHEGTE